MASPILESVSPHDVMLEGALKSLKEDLPVAAFLARHFHGEAHAALRAYVTRRIEQYDAADPARASALSLLEDLTDERHFIQRHLREGYGPLIEHLAARAAAAGAHIELAAEVVALDATGEGVVIETVLGKRHKARIVVVAVPLPLIKKLKVTPLPLKQLAAVADIGYGNVIKILLRFRTRWWAGARAERFEKLFFMFSDEVIPTWWTQYPEPHLTLTGWAAGSAADRLAGRSEKELVDQALDSLANIFAISRADLEGLLIAKKAIVWGNDPYALGAYSYWTHQTPGAIVALLSPVADKIFYAGEACYAGEIPGIVGGTVEAAFASGERAAQDILASG